MSVMLLKTSYSDSSFASAKRVDERCKCKRTSKTGKTVERSLEEVMVGDSCFSSTLLSRSGETFKGKVALFKQIRFGGGGALERDSYKVSD